MITPTDFYDQSGMITNDIDRVSGVSDYQRGSAQTSIKRTATEAAMIQDAANARAQDRLAKIESTLARLAERIIKLMQQYMTGEQVARIVTMPGKAWVNYDKDYIQGEFDFEVAAGSTEPMNETFRRQSALQLVDASMPFLEMGVANPTTLYMHISAEGLRNQGHQPLRQPAGSTAGRSGAGATAAGRSWMGSRCHLRSGPPAARPAGGMPPEMGGAACRRRMMQGPPPMPPEMAGMDAPPPGMPAEPHGTPTAADAPKTARSNC